ncbi:glycosyl transferase [Flavobacterium piscis]|uniref:Glycosyl transferase n=1 Tax=Flavobacterium piscis TaxID=1114874 RepID=A0ABX2XPL6_9FLAO|nr:glycosyltransferase [Flavobacterium piscis]OCB77775.1 glycosyl transferase [Flavobacterium piscis]OXG04605.1 glycosyl transferase [Flavobacterium piscis]
MKISVAICTYNGEKHLIEQLDSILNQTHEVDEIIVCDDLSTDKTIEILNDYKTKHSSLFYIHHNQSTLRSVKNFEKAISLCTGDFIFLSDQDDKWVPEKVEEYIAYFNSHPDIKVLSSNGYCINDHSKIQEKYALWDIPRFLKEENIDFDYYKMISQILNLATGASMAFKKEILQDILPFPIVNKFHHDEWIAMISSYQGQYELLDKKYFYYRMHDNQQVGGVFYDKNKNTKQRFIGMCNLDDENISFSLYKKRWKRIFRSYQKNAQLSKSDSKFRDSFKTNAQEIKEIFLRTELAMKKKFFLQYILLKIGYALKNKKIKI